MAKLSLSFKTEDPATANVVLVAPDLMFNLLTAHCTVHFQSLKSNIFFDFSIEKLTQCVI